MNLGLSHCTGKDCPLKDKCKRNEYFRETGNMGIRRYENGFSLLKIPPFKTVKGKFECEMFWGEPQDMLFAQLKSILSSEYTKMGTKKKKIVKPKRNKIGF